MSRMLYVLLILLGLSTNGLAKDEVKLKPSVKIKVDKVKIALPIDKQADDIKADKVKVADSIDKKADKVEYKFIPDWRKDKYDLFPQLNGKYADRHSYFGYLDSEIKRYFIAGDTTNATKMVERYISEWNMYDTAPPVRVRH